MSLLDFIRRAPSDRVEPVSQADDVKEAIITVEINDRDRLDYATKHQGLDITAVDTALLADEKWVRRRLVTMLVDELRSSASMYYAMSNVDRMRYENRLVDLLLDGELPKVEVKA